jgi:hypothetical protein
MLGGGRLSNDAGSNLVCVSQQAGRIPVGRLE